MQTLLAAIMGGVLIHHTLLRPILAAPQQERALSLKDSCAEAMLLASSLMLASALLHVLRQQVLQPAGLEVLSGLAFILLLGLALLTCMAVAKAARLSTHPLETHGTLVACDGLVLGLSLLILNPATTLIDAAIAAAGTALAFSTLLTLYTTMLERIDQHQLPPAFRGAPIALITAGLMLLALLGFSGPG
jgi:electron transport complex protein RnfA